MSAALTSRAQLKLSRETVCSDGAFSTHNSSCVVKVNGFLREVRGGTIKFLDPLYETK